MELRLSLLALIGCLIAAIELGVSASEQSMDQLQEIGLPLDKVKQVEPYKTQEDVPARGKGARRAGGRGIGRAGGRGIG